MLSEVNQYLTVPIKPEDIKAAWCGIRPLAIDPARTTAASTAAVSRDHLVRVRPSNLVTVNGGKWTTYRLMAEDALNKAIETVGIVCNHRNTICLLNSQCIRMPARVSQRRLC